MSSTRLRPYQVEAVASIKRALRSGDQSALVVSSTGSGKTLVLGEFIHSTLKANPNWRCLVLVPKIKLIRQISATLREIPHATFCGSLKLYELGQITIATYQSIVRIQDTNISFDTIILDEAHRFDPKLDSNQRQLLARFSHEDTRVVGFTATPFRGVLPIWKISNFWKAPCFKIGITQLTEMGFLIKAKMVGGASAFSTKGLKINAGDWDQEDLSALARDTAKLKSQVEDALMHLDIHNCEHVVWMCIDQDHAEATLADLRDRKEAAVQVISRDSLDERDDSFVEFEELRARHLVSVSIASEGYDFPPTDAIVFLRPTRSVVSYIQSVGRALRPSPTTFKTTALILDYGEVVKNCGKLDRPFISEDADQTRDSAALRKKLQEETDYRVLQCQTCGAFFFPHKAQDAVCTECGAPYVSNKDKNLKEKAAMGELYGDMEDDGLNLFVTGFKVLAFTLDHLLLEFQHITKDNIKGHSTVELFTPVRSHGRPTRYEMGQLRRTKAWLRDAFKLPQGLSARESAHFVVAGRATEMPRTLAVKCKDIFPRGSQPLASQVKTTDILQESMF